MKKFLIVIISLLVAAAVLFGIHKAYFTFTYPEKVAVEKRNNSGLQKTSNRVFDDADLLTNEEENELESQIKDAIEKSHTDIIVLSTNDAQGKSSMAYADDFYDTHDFGYEDSHGTGILFLIDMDNRNIWLSTSGDCITYYTSNCIDSEIDKVYSDLKAGNYYDVYEWLIADVPDIMYQKNSLSPIWAALLALVIAASVLVYFIVTRGGKVTVNADTYLVVNSRQLLQHSDVLYDKRTVTRVIESDSGGSGGGSHISSGGFSHGGGGRSF